MRASSRKTVAMSKVLRRTMSLPEILLWRVLRQRPGGMKFRKQHAYGPYALDFYCVEAALCVEVDGKSHEMGDRPKRDARRDRWVRDQGIKTLRIPAAEVLRDLEAVVRLIQEECASRSPSTGFAGPQFRVDGPPGPILDCWEQSNPKLLQKQGRMR